jgi:hypothetical protein
MRGAVSTLPHQPRRWGSAISDAGSATLDSNGALPAMSRHHSNV